MKIVYEVGMGGVAIVHPGDLSDSLDTIAKRDVPSGTAYWIVSDDKVPTDRSTRDSWRISAIVSGSPSGYGE